MKCRFTLYCESSVWIRLADPGHDLRRKLTYRFLGKVQKRHRLYISDLVIQEVMASGHVEERRFLERRIRAAHARMIGASPRAKRIAFDLLDAGGWSQDVFADMLHIGYSMARKLDALVTWDKADLARDHTRKIVQAYGRREGLLAPLIGTPEEVAEWLSIKIR